MPDPQTIWKQQPEEELRVNMEHIMNRRAEDLHASTRSEILMSVGAALFFVAIMGWRFSDARDPFQLAGFAAILVWVAVSLYWFRNQIWSNPPRPDSIASTGVEHYRKVLAERRDLLRQSWLWNGPLILSCLVLVGILTGNVYPSFQPLRKVLPMMLLLAIWVTFGVIRRRRQAARLQLEIDEMKSGNK